MGMDKHTLGELIKMAKFSYEHSKRVGAHQEFLSADREVLNKAQKYLNELSNDNPDADTEIKLNITDVNHRRELLTAFVKDWYKNNPLVSEEKQLQMVDNFLANYSV